MEKIVVGQSNNMQLQNISYKPKALRFGNSQTIINILRKNDVLSVREISEYTNLSKTSVNKIITALTKKGFIKCSGKGTSTDVGGKKPDLYTINAECSYCISISFSDYFCSGVLIDLKLNIKNTSTYRQNDPMNEDQVISNIIRIIKELIDFAKIKSDQIISIALHSPGIIDSSQEKLIKPMLSSYWHKDFAVKQEISNALPFSTRIYFDNVCRYGGYYELLRDDARWNRTVLVISTYEANVGGSIIRDGYLMHGTNGLIGEIGHITVDSASSVKCNCGNYGCFEVMVSSQNICNNTVDLFVDYPDSSLAMHIRDNTLCINNIFDAADQGDMLARTMLDKVIRYFSIVIYNARLLCDPDEVIIQYLYADSCNYFRDGLLSVISKHPFYHVYKDLLLTFSPGDKQYATDIGAALYSFNNYFNTDSTYD